MEHFVLTNLSVYKAIAEDAYAQMVKADETGRTPKSDGMGCIIRYDPERTSFKSAMIAVVFTGMWLEALMHLLIVRDHGESMYRKYDKKKTYEQKIELLGVTDGALLAKVTSFRKARNELMHEKAHFDQATIKIAQKEAQIAYEVMSEIDALFAIDG